METMRRFSPEYLRTTREGMWEDSRVALEGLELADRTRVLDVGAGTGELTAILEDAVSGDVVAVDADLDLLNRITGPRVGGDATRLPFTDDSFDLVVCQALLVNLSEPLVAIEEFARVSSDLVATIEPDNSAVTIDSTVADEPPLARRARERYLQGLETDASLGDTSALFAKAGLQDSKVNRYNHVREIEPPYSERDLEGAKRKATGSGLESDRETILASEATREDFDELREQWRKMGRTVIDQMQDGSYYQRETVPFYVTVGRV